MVRVKGLVQGPSSLSSVESETRETSLEIRVSFEEFQKWMSYEVIDS